MVLGTIFGAVLSGLLALAGNLLLGTQIIGISTTSDTIIGACVGGVFALIVSVVTLVMRKHNVTYLAPAGGTVLGILVYAVASMYNDSSSVILLGWLAFTGLVSGIGSWTGWFVFAFRKGMDKLKDIT